MNIACELKREKAAKQAFLPFIKEFAYRENLKLKFRKAW